MGIPSFSHILESPTAPTNKRSRAADAIRHRVLCILGAGIVAIASVVPTTVLGEESCANWARHRDGDFFRAVDLEVQRFSTVSQLLADLRDIRSKLLAGHSFQRSDVGMELATMAAELRTKADLLRDILAVVPAGKAISAGQKGLLAALGALEAVASPDGRSLKSVAIEAVNAIRDFEIGEQFGPAGDIAVAAYNLNENANRASRLPTEQSEWRRAVNEEARRLDRGIARAQGELSVVEVRLSDLNSFKERMDKACTAQTDIDRLMIGVWMGEGIARFTKPRGQYTVSKYVLTVTTKDGEGIYSGTVVTHDERHASPGHTFVDDGSTVQRSTKTEASTLTVLGRRVLIRSGDGLNRPPIETDYYVLDGRTMSSSGTKILGSPGTYSETFTKQ